MCSTKHKVQKGTIEKLPGEINGKLAEKGGQVIWCTFQQELNGNQ